MRVSKEQAAKNRERILQAASLLMRERGISSVGVDALAEAAGMTHGSLYSQFGSKERLVEEAVAYAISAKGQELPEVFALNDYVSEYLSAAHRDEPASGCPFAALSCEMARQSRGVRERFTAKPELQMDRIARLCAELNCGDRRNTPGYGAGLSAVLRFR
jgi:TetR/AcrR family transcriptional repressor of nem operon